MGSHFLYVLEDTSDFSKYYYVGHLLFMAAFNARVLSSRCDNVL
jgi:hypothetical protein